MRVGSPVVCISIVLITVPQDWRMKSGTSIVSVELAAELEEIERYSESAVLGKPALRLRQHTVDVCRRVWSRYLALEDRNLLSC